MFWPAASPVSYTKATLTRFPTSVGSTLVSFAWFDTRLLWSRRSFDVIADPRGEDERAVQVREGEARDTQHSLRQHARDDRAREGDGLRSARAGRDESALRGGHGRVERAARVLPAEAERPGEPDGDLHRADHVLQVVGKALRRKPRLVQRGQRDASRSLEPAEPLDAAVLRVVTAPRDRNQVLEGRK